MHGCEESPNTDNQAYFGDLRSGRFPTLDMKLASGLMKIVDGMLQKRISRWKHDLSQKGILMRSADSMVDLSSLPYQRHGRWSFGIPRSLQSQD